MAVYYKPCVTDGEKPGVCQAVSDTGCGLMSKKDDVSGLEGKQTTKRKCICCSDQTPDRSDVRGERLITSHCFEGWSPSQQKGMMKWLHLWERECEAVAVHMVVDMESGYNQGSVHNLQRKSSVTFC